jgi:hypothetical protein
VHARLAAPMRERRAAGDREDEEDGEALHGRKAYTRCRARSVTDCYRILN